MRIFKNLCFCLLIGFGACQGSDDNMNPEGGSFVASIDGQAAEFFEPAASIAEVLSADLFTVAAVTTNSSSTISLRINIGPGEALLPGTYSFTKDCELSEDGICGDILYSTFASLGVISDIYSSNISNGFFDISIDEVDYNLGGFVKGTFSGKVFDSDGTGESVEFTGGVFDALINE